MPEPLGRTTTWGNEVLGATSCSDCWATYSAVPCGVEDGTELHIHHKNCLIEVNDELYWLRIFFFS